MNVDKHVTQLKQSRLVRNPIVDFGMRVSERYRVEQIQVLCASFAYYWVFAIPPLLLLIVMIAAFFNTLTDVEIIDRLRTLIVDHAPADAQAFLLRMIDSYVIRINGETAVIAIVVAVGLSLWSVSGAVNILIVGFNRAYAVRESRSWLNRKTRSMVLSLALVLFVNLLFALVIFGERVGRWLANNLGFGDRFNEIWDMTRLPIALVSIALITTVLYWAGPNLNLPFRWVSPGSAFATLAWVILISGFSFYLDMFDPGSAYGVVGSVIMVLVFLNLSGMIFFPGCSDQRGPRE